MSPLMPQVSCGATGFGVFSAAIRRQLAYQPTPIPCPAWDCASPPPASAPQSDPGLDWRLPVFDIAICRRPPKGSGCAPSLSFSQWEKVARRAG
ncbi:hypothetical protein D3C72_1718120 [compost metagenome]